MRHAVVIDAVRTPIGRAHAEKGIYRDVRADDLSADLMKALLERVGVPAVGDRGHPVGLRQAAGRAGLRHRPHGRPHRRPADRGRRRHGQPQLCGSSLQAINQAAQSIAADCEDVQIAGGVEHMQHIPMEAGFDPSPRLFYRHSPADDEHGPDGREPGPALPDQPQASRTSSPCAATSAPPRRPTPARSPARSSRPGAATRRAGGRCMTEDQCIRRDTSLEALGALKPAFMPEGGTVTAGNSSPLNVGAAALLIMSEERAKELGLKPKVRIRAMAVAGVDPSVMGIGPVPATHKALERAGLKLDDIDLIELNEAFAAQALAVIKLLKADPEKVNVRGGAIAIGHPLGASGARIATTLIHAMEDQQGQARPGDHVHRGRPGHRDDFRAYLGVERSEFPGDPPGRRESGLMSRRS